MTEHCGSESQNPAITSSPSKIYTEIIFRWKILILDVFPAPIVFSVPVLVKNLRQRVFHACAVTAMILIASLSNSISKNTHSWTSASINRRRARIWEQQLWVKVFHHLAFLRPVWLHFFPATLSHWALCSNSGRHRKKDGRQACRSALFVDLRRSQWRVTLIYSVL